MSLILYIEDNRDIRENGIEILELGGYTVITATNGKDGIVLAGEKNPDLIICDIIMPEKDGYQVIEELKQDPLLAKTPFIFATASAEKSEMHKGMELGANAYIRKPFDGKELLDAVKYWLAQN